MSGKEKSRKPKNSDINIPKITVSPISSRTRSSRKTATASEDLVRIPKSQSRNPCQDIAKSHVPKRTYKRKRKSKPMAMSHEVPMDIDDDSRYLPPHAPSAPVIPQKTTTSTPSGSAGTHGNDQTPADEDICVICMCPPENPKTLDKCRHKFCTPCIDQCFKKMHPTCPICGMAYGKITGNMPVGTMQVYYDLHSQLPGHSGCGTVIIEYNFPNGKQTEEHPHPGKGYHGTRRVAYLPENEEGRKVLRLLQRAFDHRLAFTVGRSATTGLDDQVIWNDIHHKTNIHGGPTGFGYPDPTYLNRVQEELAAKGIV